MTPQDEGMTEESAKEIVARGLRAWNPTVGEARLLSKAEGFLLGLEAERKEKLGCDHLDGPYRKLLQELAEEREKNKESQQQIKSLVEALEMCMEAVSEAQSRDLLQQRSFGDAWSKGKEALSAYRKERGGGV